MDYYPELKKNWTLYTNGLVSEFTEQIGDGIDFCFIDTMHVMPGEIIDFLAIFPFLKEGAVVVLHDTNLHTCDKFPTANVNNILISALSGEKLLPNKFGKSYYSTIMNEEIKVPFINISAVVLDRNQKERIWDIFNLLSQDWKYMLSDNDIESFRNILDKYYDKYYLTYFDDIVTHQKRLFSGSRAGSKNNFCRYIKYKLLSKIPFSKNKDVYKRKKKELKAIIRKSKLAS